MLITFALNALVGLILGSLSGMGLGGGSLMLLWLIYAADFPPEQAKTINLLFFIPTAFISCIIRLRKGMLHIPAVWSSALLGCLSAFLISRFSQNWNTELLKKLFGVYILCIGLRELFALPKTENHLKK